MRHSLTVRLPDDLAEWLTQTALRVGVSRGRIIRQELERARGAGERKFLPLAGVVAGLSDLSHSQRVLSQVKAITNSGLLVAHTVISIASALVKILPGGYLLDFPETLPADSRSRRNDQLKAKLLRAFGQ